MISFWHAPVPNVAENHQYYNAKSLSDNDAAVLIDEKDLKKRMFDIVISLLHDEKKLSDMSEKVLKLARPDAIEVIARSVIKYVNAI